MSQQKCALNKNESVKLMQSFKNAVSRMNSLNIRPNKGFWNGFIR